MVGVGPGRRWSPVAWHASEEIAPGMDRIRLACAGSICAQVWERSNEYRFVWDEDKGMWRLDRRTHVPGG